MLPTKFWLIWPGGLRGADFFRNQPIRNKNSLWWPCLSTDRDEMSSMYRGPSIDASYQVSVHIAEGVSEEKIKMWKVNRWRTTSDGKSSHCLWQGELKNQDKMSSLYRGPFRDASYKASVHVHLVKLWQGELKMSVWYLSLMK